MSPEPGWIPPFGRWVLQRKSVMELEKRKEGGRKRQATVCVHRPVVLLLSVCVSVSA